LAIVNDLNVYLMSDHVCLDIYWLTRTAGDFATWIWLTILAQQCWWLHSLHSSVCS